MIHIQKELIECMYFDKGKSESHIAAHFKVSVPVIQRLFKLYNIEKKTASVRMIDGAKSRKFDLEKQYGWADLIKETGFIQKKRTPILAATGLTLDQWKGNIEDINKSFLNSGFVEKSFTYMKSKKYKTETYLVFDQVKFDSFKLSINAKDVVDLAKDIR